jgi:hypothetical protein
LQTAQARQYRAMENAFSSTGGIVSADEVVTRLGRHTDQPISQLARWIVDHAVLSFPWRTRTMLPLFQFQFQFQFHLASITIHPTVTAVIGELVPVLGDWDISVWFAEPNAWVSDTAPVEAIDRDVHAVLDAARAERYLARG